MIILGLQNQILILFLNEPDKETNKKALDLFGKFINFICKKFDQYKELINGETKNYFYYYKYIPESYITYLIMYIVFNPNLITLAQNNEKKYFQNIIKIFLKIIKKSTNGIYDSSFMLGILIQIKELELINTKNKFISLISINNNNTYLDNNRAKNKVSILNSIVNNFKENILEFNFDNYNQTKNSVCDLAMDIIKLNFDTKIKYENIKPLIPIIFYTKEYINKNNLSMNVNNFNLFNLLNNTNNNFTFLNGNAENNNNVNTTTSNLFGNFDLPDEESKSKNNVNANIKKNNYSRLTLENFVKKDNNAHKENLKSRFDFGKKGDDDSKDQKPLNKNLKKNIKSEIKVNQVNEKEESDEDIGNFEKEVNANKKITRVKKPKIKNAPLKLYADDETGILDLEGVNIDALYI